MDLHNTATAVLDAPTSSAACNSRVTSDLEGSIADEIPDPPNVKINNGWSCRRRPFRQLKDKTSCQSTTNCEAELSQQPTTFCNAFHHSGAHVDNCQNATFTISVGLAPEGDKDVFEVHKTMTIGKFKESFRQRWESGEEEELMLMVQKQAGADALEDRLAFNDVMEDSALVKPSKTMTKAGHCLALSLRHCMPVTLSGDLRAEQEQRQRERQAILELDRCRPNPFADRPVEQKMCPRCGMGPVVNFGCSDLAHHNQGLGLDSGGTNACPACNFFSSEWQDWAEWDEQRAIQLRNGNRRGLSIFRISG